MMPANERSTFYLQPQHLNPVQLGPDTILNLSREQQTLEKVMPVLRLLEPDDFINFMLDFYATGLGKFGNHWRYTDQLTVLCAAANLLQVENYLEIGVFRGRSLALLASQAVEANLFCFDLWVENYSGLENPGPEFVRGQLARVGHRGEASFISGSSQETLPVFLEAHPGLFFDIVTVDGDHSYGGALIDLQNVLPRVKLGGVLIFDDIRHPKHRALEHLWDGVVGSHPSFLSAKYTDIGHGVAVAVRTEGENGQQLNEANEELRGSTADPASLQRTMHHLDQELREQASTIHEMKAQLQESEADRSARLEAIHTLENILQECEADRSARLDAIHSLENTLQEWETDRTSSLEVIQNLERLRQEHEQVISWGPVRVLLNMRRIFK